MVLTTLKMVSQRIGLLDEGILEDGDFSKHRPGRSALWKFPAIFVAQLLFMFALLHTKLRQRSLIQCVLERKTTASDIEAADFDADGIAVSDLIKVTISDASVLGGLSRSFALIYFKVNEVMSTKQPCDMAYEFGNEILDLQE
nr:two-pore potassium channel 1-like [Tanacetum cinerariifolium]